MHTLLITLQIIVSVVMIIVILMQPGKTDGFTSMIGGTSDTFYAKNKSRTSEEMLRKLTIVCAVLFVAVTIAINLIK